MKIVLEAGRYLGAAVAGIVGTLNVHHIVLTGTMPSFGKRWLTAVRAEMSVVALPALASDVSIELGQADDIVIIGSAALLVQRELGLNLRLRGPSGKQPRLIGAVGLQSPRVASPMSPGPEEASQP